MSEPEETYSPGMGFQTNGSMSIEAAQAAKTEIEAAIKSMIEQFERKTGTRVEGVHLTRAVSYREGNILVDARLEVEL